MHGLHLSEVLTRYVNRSGYTSGQLARLSNIPKATIVNWMEGRVKRPRASEDLLKLAAVLHLDEVEVNDLLQSAGHPVLSHFQEQAESQGDGRLLRLLAQWEPAEAEQPEHVPFQAIADLGHFVGREGLIRALTGALLAGEHRTIYTLQGMGGVGKTTLAAHIAYRLRPHFPDGVLWASVETSDAMSILSTFARAYGNDVSQYSDLGSRSRVVRELLADKRALMVLDSVQRSDEIEPLLPPSGGCAVLVTTRRRDLAVTRGAKRFVVRPFDSQTNESLELFVRVLGETRVSAEKPVLEEIAQLLGHLPLALDVVASRLAYEPGWSAEAFLRRLRHEQRRLRELAYEQQSVRLSFEVSYEALEPDTRAFFSALGVFVGEDFSPPAAAHVAFESVGELEEMDAEDNLRLLYGLSLVQRGRPGRYRLHPLLADFARAQLPDREPWKRAAQYFATFAEMHERDYSALEVELDNILGALDMAPDLGLDIPFLTGVSALYHYLEAHGLYELALRRLERARTIAQRLTDRPSEIFILRCLGRLAERRGQDIEAEQLFEEGLQLAKQQPTVPAAVVSDLLRASGVLASRRGDYALAEAYYQEGLRQARHIEVTDTLGSLLRGLGVEAFSRGDYTRAEVLYEEGIAAPYTTGSRERQGALSWALGMLAEDQGHLEEAEAYLQESAELAQELGHRERQTLILRDLGVIAWERGDTDRARSYFAEGLTIARELGHPWRINRILLDRGELGLAAGDLDEAQACFQEVADLARQSESRVMLAEALFGLARSAYRDGDSLRAQRLGRESLLLFQQSGHHKAAEVKAWLEQASDRLL